jgi:hypothetical protein
MQKRRTIKWDANDEKQLRQSVKEHNARIEREIRHNPEFALVAPKKIKISEAIKEAKSGTRRDYNTLIKDIGNIKKKNAFDVIRYDNGIRITKYQDNLLRAKTRRINREREREISRIRELDATVGGERTGLKRGEMGDERLIGLQPKKYRAGETSGRKEFNAFVNSVENAYSRANKQRALDQYKTNYLKSLKDNFSEFGDRYRQLKQTIEKLPPEVIDEIYRTEEHAKISFHYDKTEKLARLEILEDIWQNATNG